MTRDELFEYIKRIDDPGKDYGKILSNLHYTHFYLMDQYKRITDTYNLTFPQSNVLGIIVHHYPKASSLEDIKAMVLEPNSDVSRTVTRLVAKGYAQKVPDKTNRRKVCIKATAKGVKISKKIESDARFAYFTKDLGVSEARAFIRILESFRKGS